MSTTGQPRVSTVMIFLNAGVYLDDAIASVLAQTVQDVQLVLVDDGSTDGSREAAEAWAQRDPRVVAVHHPGNVNRGMGASRALGIQHARAPWIAFLDGDDVWAPDHLERQLDLATRHPQAGIVVSPATIWVSWRGEGRDHVRHLPYPTDTLLPAGALLDSVTFAGAPIPTCGLMFRRELVPADGPGDPAFRGLFEDQTMVARLGVGVPAVAAPEATSFYRQHAASAVHRSPGRGNRDPATLRYLAWIESFLAEHGELTADRRGRLAERRSVFEPRWAFWIWYGSRWLVLHVLSPRALRWLRGGRSSATGVLDEQGPRSSP
jgi:glycosyltransferase involved in cell wall biosynthesis